MVPDDGAPPASFGFLSHMLPHDLPTNMAGVDAADEETVDREESDVSVSKHQWRERRERARSRRVPTRTVLCADQHDPFLLGRHVMLRIEL
jgi:hypothetical protein